MSNTQARIELLVDVIDLPKQRAHALPTITPAELIRAILQEFTELTYLGDDPANYRLCKGANQTPLAPDRPLGEQVRGGDHLLLQETIAPLPAGATRPSHPLYLREPGAGKVFPIHWLPAIIGRKDGGQADKEAVAVDLSVFPAGLRVSRRHARLTEEDGQLYIASLSDNPTALKHSTATEGDLQPVTAEKVAVTPGQKIHFVRSGIDLQVIVRESGSERAMNS